MKKMMLIGSNAPHPPLNPSGGVRQTEEKKAAVCTPPLKVRGGREGLCVVVTLLTMVLLFCGSAFAAPADIWESGQKTCYDTSGSVITCAGTEQDGDLKPGVAWPNPRFTKNADGTVTDNLTGLIWLTNANCTETVGGVAKGSGYLTWANALTWSNNLASGACSLSDGSSAGDWRLPNRKELLSLVNFEYSNPALSNTAGTGKWTAGAPFDNVQSYYYWSSTTSANDTSSAWYVYMVNGGVSYYGKGSGYYVWPVRGGQSGSLDTLTISKAGTGTGTVTSDPAGINCGDDCSETYAENTEVALTAAADAGSTFTGWSGDCTGTASPLAVLVDKDMTCTATFTLNTHTLTVNKTGTGSGTVGGGGTYAYGTSHDITAVAAAGSTFTGWSGDCTGTASPLAVLVDKDKTCTATFTLNAHTLTVNSTGTGSGTVGGGGTYDYGTSHDITAAAAAGSTFTGWSGDCTGTASPLAVLVDKDKTCTATFTLNAHTLTVNKTGTGSGTVGGGGTYDYGTTQQVTASADAGSAFTGWSGDCTGTASPLAVLVDKDKTCTATFTLNNSVTVRTATDNGDIRVETNSPGCGFSNVATKTEAQVGNDPSYDYPYGLVEFTLPCESADVTITFPGDISGTQYRKYGPTPPGFNTSTWYDFGGTITGNQITLHLVDGELGDDTGVDGVIYDVGGPALPLGNGHVTAVPTMNEWGMILFMLLSGIASVYYLTRQRNMER